MTLHLTIELLQSANIIISNFVDPRPLCYAGDHRLMKTRGFRLVR